MQFKAVPTIAVIKKEEKEAKLKAFIADHFARRQETADSADGLATDCVFLLVARSYDSPVVRALADAIAEAGAQDIMVKALILMPGSQLASSWPAALTEITDGRTTGDLRLLDAHEQLWLNGETVWIGDCMRREPAKRDAYECYAYGCEMTAKSVEAAFNRLWEKGSTVAMNSAAIGRAESPVIDPHLAHVTQSEPVGPTASTRH